MHAKWSQCCSSSRKYSGFKPEEVSCAFSLNSAARRSHSSATCLSCNDMDHSHDELRQELQRQKFPRALVIICGNKRGLANQYLRRHVLPVRASVQLPASFSPDPLSRRFAEPHQNRWRLGG